MDEKTKKIRSDKIKKFLFRAAGASAGVAAVIVITLSSLIVSGFEYQVVGDKVYYQVEVALEQTDTTEADEVLEAPNASRIVLTSQFGDVTQALDVGYNTGVFDNIKSNTTYHLKVEEFNGTTWVTLDEKSFKREERSSGIIKTIDETGSVKDFNRNFSFDLDFDIQNGDDLVLKELHTNDVYTLSLDTTLLTFERSYQSTSIWQIVNQTTGEVLDEKAWVSIPYINGYIEVLITDQVYIYNHYTSVDERVYYEIEHTNGYKNVLDGEAIFSIDDIKDQILKIKIIYDDTNESIFELDFNAVFGMDIIYTTLETETSINHHVYVINDQGLVDSVYLDDNLMYVIEASDVQKVYELILNASANYIEIILNGEDVIIYTIIYEEMS